MNLDIERYNASQAGAGQIDEPEMARWLEKSRRIQWDYENTVKRKGRLERLR